MPSIVLKHYQHYLTYVRVVLFNAKGKEIEAPRLGNITELVIGRAVHKPDLSLDNAQDLNYILSSLPISPPPASPF